MRKLHHLPTEKGVAAVGREMNKQWRMREDAYHDWVTGSIVCPGGCLYS